LARRSLPTFMKTVALARRDACFYERWRRIRAWRVRRQWGTLYGERSPELASAARVVVPLIYSVMV